MIKKVFKKKSKIKRVFQFFITSCLLQKHNYFTYFLKCLCQLPPQYFFKQTHF
jgi:hypothetical protein